MNLFWNQEQRRLRAPWRILAVMITFLLVSILLGVAIGVAALARMLASGQLSAEDPAALAAAIETGSGFVLLGAVVSLVAALLAVAAVGRWLDRRPLADFGLHLAPRWWADLAFGLALGAALMAAIFLAEKALGWITVKGFMQTTAKAFWLGLLPPLVMAFSIGIYEELLMRGYVLRNLAEGLNIAPLGRRGAVLAAWVLSSVVFGLIHAANPNTSVVSTVSLMLAGLFLGLGYVLTGELAIPIGLHITWNFFQGAVFGFPVSGLAFSETSLVAIDQGGPAMWTGGAFGPEAGLIGLMAILLGSLVTWAWVRRRQPAGSLHLELTDSPPSDAPSQEP